MGLFSSDEETIKGVGSYEYDDKNLSCDFNISADEFFNRFSDVTGDLPSGAIEDIRKAIDSGREVKISRKYRRDVGSFFDRVETASKSGPAPSAGDSSTTMGFDEEEADEAAEAEEMKKEGATSDQLYYEDQDTSTEGIDTYDEDTGEREGEIILGEEGATGDLVPLEIKESVKAEYEHNAEEPKEEGREVSGMFKVANPSNENNIWDVDIDFTRDQDIVWAGKREGTVDKEEPEATSGEDVEVNEPIHIKNLEPRAEMIYDYSIENFQQPPLKVKEFISTLNDEEVESYSLLPNAENKILFKLTASNTADYALKNIKIVKEVENIFMNVDVIEGNATVEPEGIVWKIEKLEANEETVVKINMDLDTGDEDVKANTGKISADYEADNALTGMKVDSFDAYSSNFVGIQAVQKEDDPDMYQCSLVFENKSDFQMNLVNLDVFEEGNPDEKLLDIDTGEIPTIAAGAQWKSVEWETETDEGFEPLFHKTVEFFLVSERLITTTGSISIDDIELAVAVLKGMVHYSVSKVPSYRETSFNSLLEIDNSGSADLNEVIMEETIQAGYIPPTADQVELFIVRPEVTTEEAEGELEVGFEEEETEGEEEEAEGEEEEAEGEEEELEEETEPEVEEESEVDWDYLGDPIAIDESLIEIEPDNQDPEVEHILRINLTNLSEHAMGMFIPGMIIRAKYPITASKPEKDTEYVSNVKYVANTLPAGTPIEIVPEEERIPVVHIRRRTVKGKAIHALSAPNEYEITLTVKNMGDSAIENVKVRDVVDKNSFEYANFSLEPSEYDELEGKDLLIWEIDKIEANDEYSITYTLTGKGDYRVSDQQFSV